MKIMNLKCKDLKNASFDMSLKSMYFVIKSMINWLQLLGVPNLVCKNVLLEIKAWLARQWEVQTIHVFREANRAALSSRRITIDRGVHTLILPLVGFRHILWEDNASVPRPRTGMKGYNRFPAT